MSNRPAIALACLIGIASPLLAIGPVLAQTTAAPSTPASTTPNRESLSVDQMLEQLAPTGRTRGMRNLVPVPVQPPAALPAVPVAPPVDTVAPVAPPAAPT